MVRAGRFLQLLACLGLMVSPFLAWAEVNLLGSDIGIPGLLLHGSVLLAAGVMGAVAALIGSRRYGFRILLAVLSAWALYHDFKQITERTEYWMGKVQLWVTGLNALVTKFGMSRIELFQKRASDWDYLANGIGLGLAAVTVLVLGILLEAWAESREGRTLVSLLIGRPACGDCGSSFEFSMNFCPGCGRRGGAVPCAKCGAVIKQGYKFCAGCGERVEKNDPGQN